MVRPYFSMVSNPVALTCFPHNEACSDHTVEQPSHAAACEQYCFCKLSHAESPVFAVGQLL